MLCAAATIVVVDANSENYKSTALECTTFIDGIKLSISGGKEQIIEKCDDEKISEEGCDGSAEKNTVNGNEIEKNQNDKIQIKRHYVILQRNLLKMLGEEIQ